jgi:hypothetical protein
MAAEHPPAQGKPPNPYPATPRPYGTRNPERNPPDRITPVKGLTLLNARTASEVIKAQLGKVRLSQMKGDLVDRSQAIAHVFALARAERDALLNWPAQIAAELAAELLEVGVSPHTVLTGLEHRLRDYLQTLGDIRPKVD